MNIYATYFSFFSNLEGKMTSENQKLIEKINLICPAAFFFLPKPDGKKKPLKNLLPSYLLDRSTLLYVITRKKKNHTPLDCGGFYM